LLVGTVAAAEGSPPPPWRDIEAGAFRLDFGAGLRVRYELEDNKSAKGYAPGVRDGYLLERLMLEGTVRIEDGPKLFVQLRDARPFGTNLKDDDFTKSNPYHDPLDIRQAYVAWKEIGGTPLGLRVGRQSISYGDQRVFGPGQWGNTGRYAWDAAILKVDTRWYSADAWVGKRIENRPDRWPNPRAEGPTVAVAYLALKNLPFRLDLLEATKLDQSGKVEGESGTGNLRSFSVGAQLEGVAWERFDYGATWVSQFGDHGTDRIRAYGWNGKVGVRVPAPWDPRIMGQVTFGSGDRDPTDGVHGTFDGVLGGADIAFYGFTNVMYWPNLLDRELTLGLSPHARVEIELGAHLASLASARDAWYSTGMQAQRRDPSGASGTDLGRELDAKVLWQGWDGGEVLFAAGQFFPGSFVRSTGSAPPVRWLALQVAQEI
jgi:hypothetical protein